MCAADRTETDTLRYGENSQLSALRNAGRQAQLDNREINKMSNPFRWNKA